MLLQMELFHSFLWLSNSPLYHILLSQSGVGGHLGCFHVLVIVNSAAMNIGVHVKLKLVFSFLFRYIPRRGIYWQFIMGLFLKFKFLSRKDQ